MFKNSPSARVSCYCFARNTYDAKQYKIEFRTSYFISQKINKIK